MVDRSAFDRCRVDGLLINVRPDNDVLDIDAQRAMSLSLLLRMHTKSARVLPFSQAPIVRFAGTGPCIGNPVAVGARGVDEIPAVCTESVHRSRRARLTQRRAEEVCSVTDLAYHEVRIIEGDLFSAFLSHSSIPGRRYE